MMVILWEIFFSFLKVGMLSFGGAYSLIPVIEKEVVANNQWLSNDEFLRVLGMVQFIPGAISIKFATFTGYKVAGISGAIAANLGNLIFPAGLMIIIYYLLTWFEKNLYVVKAFEGIKYTIIGMIFMVMVQYLMRGTLNYKSIFLLVLGAVLFYLKIHPAVIVVIAAILGILIYR